MQSLITSLVNKLAFWKLLPVFSFARTNNNVDGEFEGVNTGDLEDYGQGKSDEEELGRGGQQSNGGGNAKSGNNERKEYDLLNENQDKWLSKKLQASATHTIAMKQYFKSMYQVKVQQSLDPIFSYKTDQQSKQHNQKINTNTVKNQKRISNEMQEKQHFQIKNSGSVDINLMSYQKQAQKTYHRYTNNQKQQNMDDSTEQTKKKLKPQKQKKIIKQKLHENTKYAKKSLKQRKIKPRLLNLFKDKNHTSQRNNDGLQKFQLKTNRNNKQ